MPIFEFDCLKCGNSFEELVGASEDMSKFACPSCNSRRVKRRLSVFGFSSKNSSGNTVRSSGSSCSGCAATSCASCKP
ncbi:MAG: zinc ribbon domain-containing protein [bacterium]|nr:zinc ribbon domain-containing protein [bacterium]